MFGDDDDEEESAAGATRYPVMPSLVALQQMRGRLHMAQLGRKLMKWTSVAAAAELRKLSAELQVVYQTFAEDMREAFILLARCRYFFPDLNKIVLSDVQKLASITVDSSLKTVSGVRLLQYRTIESGSPYDCLGIGTGGEAILETKKAWLKLLMLQIQMVQLRRSFVIVETAYKNATKKMNVLGKITIPRTLTTMKFIDTELDETDREEHFRLKKLQNKKQERAAKNKDPRRPPKIIEDEEPGDPKPPALPSKSEPSTPPLPSPQEDHEDPKPPSLPSISEPRTPPLPSAQEDLEVLKEKVSNVIDLSNKISQKSVGKRVESFVKKAEELKEILEDLTPVTVQSTKSPTTSQNVSPKTPSIASTYTPIQPLVETNASANEFPLGTFIREEEIITRIAKTKNPDGSVTQEKKIIKRTRVVNTPVESSQSTNSQRNVNFKTRTGNNPNIMTAISNDNHILNNLSKISVKSDIIKRVEAMSHPKERCCLSCIDILENSICDISCQSFNLEEMCDSLTWDENMFSREMTEISEISGVDFPDDSISLMNDFSESERRLLSRKVPSEPVMKNNFNDSKPKQSRSFDDKNK